MQTSGDSPAPAPLYIKSTREAARRLGYTSLDAFYDALKAGYIAGAERRGNGPRPRYWYRIAELAYIGPVSRPTDHRERLELERRARAEAVRPVGGFVNKFLRTRKAVA